MRSSFLVTVHMLFLQDDKILLLRRFNTGYGDGNYSLVAGHVDAGESITRAAIREAMEEAGVVLHPEDLQVVHVMNRKSNDERVDFFIIVKAWSGEITNTEPDKCDDLAWFSLDKLPVNMIPYVRYAIGNYQKGILYSEFGWQQPPDVS